MPLQLAIAGQSGIVTEHKLLPGRRYVLGRSEQADIIIPHPQVSREHALLCAENDDNWSLDDTSSTGCYLNGQPVSSMCLGDAQVLHFGPVACEVKRLSDDITLRTDSVSVWRQQRLNQLKQDLSDCDDTRSLIEMVQNCFTQTLHCERAAVIFCDSQANISFADGHPEWMNENRFTGSRTVIRNAITQGEPLAIGNISAKPQYNQQASVVNNHICAAVCIPLISDHGVTGVLYGDNTSGRQYFTGTEVAFARQIADILSLRLLFLSIEHKLTLLRRS